MKKNSRPRAEIFFLGMAGMTLLPVQIFSNFWNYLKQVEIESSWHDDKILLNDDKQMTRWQSMTAVYGNYKTL